MSGKNLLYLIWDILHLLYNVIKICFNKYGFIGVIFSFLLSFTFYTIAVNKYHSVQLEYPEYLDESLIKDLAVEIDKKNIVNNDYKIYNNGLSKDIIIEPGHNFGYVLYHLAMPNFQVERIIELLKKNANFSNIKPGQKISVYYDCTIEYFVNNNFIQYSKKREHDTWQGALPMERNDICLLRKMIMSLDMEHRAVVTAIGDTDFDVKINKINVTKKTRFTKGKIENSLYSDAVKAGTPPGIIQAMIQEYSFDVDFQRDIHSGDTFLFVFDELFDEYGDKIRNGTFKYGNLTLGGKSHKVYYFDGQFYNEKAESVRRAMMKTPVDGARISSKFTSARKHPVLGFTRKHEGVDFAVPSGTPIFAAADGVISFAGWSNGYGNYVKIKHNTEFGTNYAHMSKMKVRKGDKVKQRQVIGYSGMTGLCSGPHLHFEVEKNGKKINPSSQKFASITRLAGSIRDRFEEYRRSIKDYLAKNDND